MPIYYCVRIPTASSVEILLSRFRSQKNWENISGSKSEQQINSVEVGAKIAVVLIVKRKNQIKTGLEIHAIGTVLDNPQNGYSLLVDWGRTFSPFTTSNKGGFRSSITKINDAETIRKIFRNSILQLATFYSIKEFRETNAKYPCFVFHKSRWDDYGYKTQFEVWFHNASRRKVHIGTTKIISKDDGYDSENRVKPENEFPFNGRTEAFCSLGQDNSYYKSLRDSVESSLADYYLDAVNDLAINKGLVDSFEHEKVFKKSLIRSSEAQKALREGYNIYHDLRIENLFTFTFTTQIGTAAVPHTIEFDYKEHINLPHRIKVLIGKNGTGKTQYLARLASTLSGYQELGTFSTKYLPPFSRVLAISYSLFDRFPRPAHTKTYSYYYCGFQGKKGFLTENQLEAKIRHALESVEKADRMSLFGKYLSIVLSDDLASELLDDDFDQFKANAFSLYDDHGSSKYSSGQIIMILVLSEVLAFITSESLLLFDEPETHLHPNGISRFINVLNRILKRFNSYAIISSHSPQLVQEVPSKDITIIDRIDTTPIFRKMDIESFGENLNTITQRVFQTISHDEYYREFLLHLSEKSTYKQIIKSFEQNSLPLSLAARLYLQSLYKK